MQTGIDQAETGSGGPGRGTFQRVDVDLQHDSRALPLQPVDFVG